MRRPAPDTLQRLDDPEPLAGVDESSGLVFRAFIRTLRLHRRHMLGVLGEREVHPGQAFCLRLLAEGDGRTQRELADGLHIAAPTLSRMVRSMEQSGLVQRRGDFSDQRLTRVFITDAGREVAARLHDATMAYVEQTLTRMSELDRRELARLLDEFAGLIEGALETRRSGQVLAGAQAAEERA